MRRSPGRALLAVLLAGCAHAEPAAPPPAEPTAFSVHVSGSGRPVVFIPDLEASSAVWDTTLAHLGGRVEAHTLDIAGFAGKPAIPGPLVPQLRDELARYLHEHARGAVLVGHMFGAELAYWLAMTEPDVVGGVIAIDAPPSRSDGSVDPEAAEGRDAILHATPEQFTKMVTHRLGSMVADPATAQRLIAAGVHTEPSVTADAFYDMMTRDLRASIPRIRAPVLLLLTTENFPPQARAMVEEAFREQLAPIPQHELVVIPGSHHYAMYDAPDAFFAQLDRFLAAMPPR